MLLGTQGYCRRKKPDKLQPTLATDEAFPSDTLGTCLSWRAAINLGHNSKQCAISVVSPGNEEGSADSIETNICVFPLPVSI